MPTCHDTSHVDKPNAGRSVHHLQRHPHQQLQHHVESQVFYPVTDHIHPFIHSFNTVGHDAGDPGGNNTASAFEELMIGEGG